MAERGYIVAWMDQNRDRDEAYAAIARMAPECQAHFLNPRHFDGVESVGIDHRTVRGYALITDDPRIKAAHDAAGIEYTELDVPKRSTRKAQTVLVYMQASDNEWNDAMRTAARTNYPAIAKTEVPVSSFSGIEPVNAIAVVVPDGRPDIVQAYTRAHKRILSVPRPGLSVSAESGASVDVSVLEATLALPADNIQAVVGSQMNATWLRALADAEKAGEDRQDVHEHIHARMLELGSGNPHARELEPEVPAIEQAVATSADEEAGADAIRDMSSVLDAPLRIVQDRLDAVDDLDTLCAMLDSEKEGKDRASVATAIGRRINAVQSDVEIDEE